MKTQTFKITSLGVLLLFTSLAFGQKKLGSVETLKSSFQTTASLKKQSGKPTIKLPVDGGLDVSVTINVSETKNGKQKYIGNVSGNKKSTFHLEFSGEKVNGTLIQFDSKKAFNYYSNEKNEAFVAEVDIHDVVCMDYHPIHEASEPETSPSYPAGILDTANLQSLPGATGVVLLDFNGELVENSSWSGGEPINAAHSGFSEEMMIEIWKMISEDFRPFQLNITTNEAVYDQAPLDRRQRVIFTPTNYFFPGYGGVAFIGSFNWENDDPCWVFNYGIKAAGEAGSHEIGHTLKLGHDGRTVPDEVYYAGQGNWAPIMGVGYVRDVVQWSKGEYNHANNLEDDINIIATQNGILIRADDHGNSFAQATALVVSNNSISASQNAGVIETATDYDVFSFNFPGGSLNLTVKTDSLYANLNAEAKLFDQAGQVVVTSNPVSNTNASISRTLPAGIYYLQIDGTGEADPVINGYSDYSSLGAYFISGNFSSSVQSPFLTQYIPGIIEAENYDLGGQNIAFYDNSITNEGGAYRTDEVDVQSSVSGGYNVGWIRNGEWLEYTIASVSAGIYSVSFNVASGNVISGSRITVSLDGSVLGHVYPATTGGWQNWQTLTLHNITLATSTNSVLRLDFLGGDFNLDNINFIIQYPYAYLTIPGTIEAEYYDVGGEGISFHDVDAENLGGALRFDAVDIESSGSSGYNVGWIRNGEWLEYSIASVVSGTYNISFVVASGNITPGSRITATIGDSYLGEVYPVTTGGWQTYQTLKITNVSIAGGTNKLLRLDFLGGDFNLDKIKVEPYIQAPYGTHYIPGIIPVVQYDQGGEAVAYHDIDAGNIGGEYRNDDVDIESASNGSPYIAWVRNGEWLEFTTYYASPGNYRLSFLVASENVYPGSKIAAYYNGVYLGEAYPVNTGGWTTWQPIYTSNFQIQSSTNGVLRLEFSGGNFNLLSLSTEYAGFSKTAADLDVNSNEISMYPVPAHENLHISNLPSDGVKLQVTDLNGRELVSTDLNGEREIDLTVSSLEKGYYILLIHTSEGIRTKRFVK